MKDSIRRSQQEHAASLAATVRRTLQEEGGAPRPPAEPEPAARRSGRIAGAVALVLGLAALGFLLVRPAPETATDTAATSVAVLEILQGTVDVLHADSNGGPPGAGEPIPAGTVIETRDATGGGTVLASDGSSRPEPGRVAFRLTDGASVRLDTESRVRLASTSVLELERGAVYIDAAAIGAAVEVRTTLGVVRDIGTQFEVRLVEEAGSPAVLRTRVREGAVVLERDAGPQEAHAGEELTIDGSGHLTRGSIAIHGAHWDWVLAVAPAPEIEGERLRPFLDWVTREGGWTLEFDDDETATLASKIVLHGDVRDLTPPDAAALVLQGSQLEYRLQDGRFIVTRDQKTP